MKKLVVSFFVISLIIIGCSQNPKLSEDPKKELLIEIKGKPQDLVDSILNYTKEILIIIGLGAGIVLGYPALRKKLMEDHIKKLIDDIQSSNKSIKIQCQTLIDNYYSKTYRSDLISISDIQQTYNELDSLHKQALNASKEVVTYVFMLKSTIQGVLKIYDPMQVPYLIYSNEYYGSYITILHEIIFFTTKIVNIPSSSRTVRFKYINKKIEKFIIKDNFRKFKYFEQGVDYRYTSPLLLSFYGNIHKFQNTLILKSAYKIFNSPVPIIRLLYLNGLYFAPILKKKEKTLFIEERLYLIGFKSSIRYDEKGEKEIVSLLFCNISDTMNFTGSIKKEDLENDFIDDYIPSKDLDLKKALNLTFGTKEEITIEFEKSYLKELYKRNKRLIKNKMRNELP
jgi:hypothetical protein